MIRSTNEISLADHALGERADRLEWEHRLLDSGSGRLPRRSSTARLLDEISRSSDGIGDEHRGIGWPEGCDRSA